MMKKIAWFLIPLSMAVFVLVGADNACAVKDNASAAPAFTLEDLNGTKHSLSDYEGKVLFLNIWATWCPPCRAEIPDFIEVYDEYKAKGLAILGVSVDQISPDQVNQFVKRYKMNYPVAMATNKLLQDYPFDGSIPTTFVIDGTGKMRYKKIGMMAKKELIDLFNRFSQ
jgi:peroxiredoxin